MLSTFFDQMGAIESTSGGSGTGGDLPSVRLGKLGIVLPRVAPPVAAYVPTRLVDRLLYVSGQIPVRDGVLVAKGVVRSKVGSEVPAEGVDVETARACARQCTLNGLAAAAAVLSDRGGIDAIEGVIRVGCFVACGPEFVDHPKVANGASELLVEVFGEAGRHSRAAVGAPSLPLGAPVEVEFLFLVR